MEEDGPQDLREALERAEVVETPLPPSTITDEELIELAYSALSNWLKDPQEKDGELIGALIEMFERSGRPFITSMAYEGDDQPESPRLTVVSGGRDQTKPDTR